MFIMERHYARTKVNKKIILDLIPHGFRIGDVINERTKHMQRRHKQGVMQRLYFLLQREKVGSSYWRAWKKHRPR